MYTIASLPAIQRDLFLSRALRRAEDAPKSVSTLKVEWSDMIVEFATDSAISESSVQVAEEISIPIFTKRMESLLDCGAVSEGAAEWILKYSCRISEYGSAEQVRCLLCDKVAELNSQTGETVGVLKIKRRSVSAGHAKIRLVPADGSLQLVVRHQTAQGLKAVWKSVLWRLRPSYPAREKGEEAVGGVQPTTAAGQATNKVVAPCVRLRERKGGYYFDQKIAWLSEQGVEVDLTKDIDVILPLEGFVGRELPYDGRAVFYCRLEFGSRLPAGKPEGIAINGNVVEVSDSHWRDFASQAKALSDWLGLGWTLPAEG